MWARERDKKEEGKWKEEVQRGGGGSETERQKQKSTLRGGAGGGGGRPHGSRLCWQRTSEPCTRNRVRACGPRLLGL